MPSGRPPPSRSSMSATPVDTRVWPYRPGRVPGAGCELPPPLLRRPPPPTSRAGAAAGEERRPRGVDAEAVADEAAAAAAAAGSSPRGVVEDNVEDDSVAPAVAGIRTAVADASPFAAEGGCLFRKRRPLRWKELSIRATLFSPSATDDDKSAAATSRE